MIHLILWNIGQIQFDRGSVGLFDRLHRAVLRHQECFALWQPLQLTLMVELPSLILFQLSQELCQARAIECHPFEVVLALVFAPLLQNEILLVLRASMNLEEGICDTLDPLTIDIGIGKTHIVGFLLVGTHSLSLEQQSSNNAALF